MTPEETVAALDAEEEGMAAGGLPIGAAMMLGVLDVSRAHHRRYCATVPESGFKTCAQSLMDLADDRAIDGAA